MDLAIEANRNSALFNTMQQVLDVYNPLLHKARPTVVNQTKHRIKVSPTRWGNTFDSWNGQRTVRFDLPRIATLTDFTLKCAFKIPGEGPSIPEREATGDRGFAKRTLKVGDITDNTDAPSNTARGRLDRVYADRLFGFNMIRRYTVSSKSRQIFTATGEYLLTRFSQMDEDMKKSVLDATTPVDLFAPNCDDAFYAPNISYYMTIPLFYFFNEHITSALDVNFSEEVHIDFELRPPSQLFYYGQLGDLGHIASYVGGLLAASNKYIGGTSGQICWDQAVNETALGTVSVLGTAEADFTTSGDFQIGLMQSLTANHIQGIGAPFDAWGAGYGAELGAATSGPTFAFPDVDSNGESVQVQFEGNADYIVQDTDAARALRGQMFPEQTGLTTITFDTSQETFTDLFASTSSANNLLDARSGGTFSDPSQSASGINIGDSTRFVDLQLKTNNLVQATHFMVRKHSDMGGDGNTNAGTNARIVGVNAAANKVGAHRIYTRCLKVHYFQLLAAGRVIYESDGDSHLNLTQSGMYNGTGLEWGSKATNYDTRNSAARDPSRTSGRPFYVYSVNFGLQASRLENTGSLSYQNLNNPTLRIYFKPDTWAEYTVANTTATSQSDALTAAALGVQVDVIHEFFNVVTINSGNGEITSGLNQ